MSKPVWQVGPVELADNSGGVIHRFCEIRKVYIGETYDHRGAAHACEWTQNGLHWQGNWEGRSGKNLAPPPKKTVRVNKWIVVYPNGSTCSFFHKDEAINEAKKHGFALLEIDREVTEGQGLQ